MVNIRHRYNNHRQQQVISVSESVSQWKLILTIGSEFWLPLTISDWHNNHDDDDRNKKGKMLFESENWMNYNQKKRNETQNKNRIQTGLHQGSSSSLSTKWKVKNIDRIMTVCVCVYIMMDNADQFYFHPFKMKTWTKKVRLVFVWRKQEKS